MFRFNGAGKKLAAVNVILSSRKAEAEAQKEKLGSIERECGLVDADIKRIAEIIETERREQALAEQEKARLVMETAAARQELTQLRQDIAEAKEAADTARARKERLLADVADAESMVHREHLAAEASAAAARTSASVLQQEHEKERARWQALRSQHEELRLQLEATQQQCDHARSQRNEAKKLHTVTCDELRELRLTHTRMEAEHAETEAMLSKENATRQELDNEISALDQQHGQIMTSCKELDASNKDRQDVLRQVREDLGRKQEALHVQLKEFETRFDTAKVAREQTQLEHDGAREQLSSLLPEYFKLQTDHTVKRRETEQVRREHEMLGWEHHKVQRDLDMLSKSYDPSC